MAMQPPLGQEVAAVPLHSDTAWQFGMGNAESRMCLPVLRTLGEPGRMAPGHLGSHLGSYGNCLGSPVALSSPDHRLPGAHLGGSRLAPFPHPLQDEDRQSCCCHTLGPSSSSPPALNLSQCPAHKAASPIPWGSLPCAHTPPGLPSLHRLGSYLLSKAAAHKAVDGLIQLGAPGGCQLMQSTPE